MVARTIDDLISSCYTIGLGEFLGTYDAPLLICAGVLDLQLLSPRFRHRSTMPLGLATSLDTGVEPHRLMGTIELLRSRAGETTWKRLGIGRADDNDIVIDDPAVSEYHCYIKRQDGDLVVGDLGSTNGTHHNAERIKAPMLIPLVDQDIITLGRLSYQFFTPAVLYHYLRLCPA